MTLTPAQRAKMQQRLNLRFDRSDTGALLPQTGAALALPAADALQQGARAEAVAQALVTERLVVPVPVESHPDETGEHRPQGLGEEDQIPLPVVQTPDGEVVLAFSSVEQLHAWDPKARPMVMTAQRVAMTASQVAAPPGILIDPSSAHPVFLPVGAVHALIGGDRWIAPWNDAALAAELKEIAQSQCEIIVSLRLQPALTQSDPDGQLWWGGVEVELYLDTANTFFGERQQALLAAAMRKIGSHPRLEVAAPILQFTPRPVTLA